MSSFVLMNLVRRSSLSHLASCFYLPGFEGTLRQVGNEGMLEAYVVRCQFLFMSEQLQEAAPQLALQVTRRRAYARQRGKLSLCCMGLIRNCACEELADTST